MFEDDYEEFDDRYWCPIINNYCYDYPKDCKTCDEYIAFEKFYQIGDSD